MEKYLISIRDCHECFSMEGPRLVGNKEICMNSRLSCSDEPHVWRCSSCTLSFLIIKSCARLHWMIARLKTSFYCYSIPNVTHVRNLLGPLQLRTFNWHTHKVLNMHVHSWFKQNAAVLLLKSKKCGYTKCTLINQTVIKSLVHVIP